MTGILLAKAASGQQKAVLEALLSLDETEQQPFEVLILALQAIGRPFGAVCALSPAKNATWDRM